MLSFVWEMGARHNVVCIVPVPMFPGFGCADKYQLDARNTSVCVMGKAFAETKLICS